VGAGSRRVEHAANGDREVAIAGSSEAGAGNGGAARGHGGGEVQGAVDSVGGAVPASAYATLLVPTAMAQRLRLSDRCKRILVLCPSELTTFGFFPTIRRAASARCQTTAAG
jgi:hypothetical protein